MKGLIIRERWLRLILDGSKTWEMRSKRTFIREEIALIEKGGKAVVGVVRIADCLSVIMDLQDYADAEPFHRIPPADQAAAFAHRWCVPWVLANARPLRSPIPYQAKPGQVNWVVLDDAIADQLASL